LIERRKKCKQLNLSVLSQHVEKFFPWDGIETIKDMHELVSCAHFVANPMEMNECKMDQDIDTKSSDVLMIQQKMSRGILPNAVERGEMWMK